jgi:hypothetical protein
MFYQRDGCIFDFGIDLLSIFFPIPWCGSLKVSRSTEGDAHLDACRQRLAFSRRTLISGRSYGKLLQ